MSFVPHAFLHCHSFARVTCKDFLQTLKPRTRSTLSMSSLPQRGKEAPAGFLDFGIGFHDDANDELSEVGCWVCKHLTAEG